MTNEEAIDEVMDYFNFEKVHQVMTALNWTWDKYDGVPDIPALRKCARNLLRSVAKDHEGISLGTGGFYAACYEPGNLCLSFVVTEWSNYG